MAVVIRDLATDADHEGFTSSAAVTIDGRERRLALRRFGNHPDLARREEVFDPFAVALLVPAMLRGGPLIVEGGIDEVLLGNLRGPVQATLRLMAPAWRQVPVEADARPSATHTDWTRGAAMAMSGGIDSMHLARHRLLDPAVPEPLRVRLLVHHHVGAHGEDDAVFEEQLAHARRIADRLGVPLVGTICRLDEAYRGMKFIHCVLPRNVAASMAVDHLFAAFHYASSEPLGGRPTMSRFEGIATLEPQLLPLFSTTRTTWLPFGGDTSRLRKTAEVIGDDRLCGDLLVCVRGFRRDRAALNCGCCFKCARVLFHAEADGRLDAVAGTFDMAAFEAGRTHSLLRLLRLSLLPWTNENDVDLLQYMHDRDYPFPAWARPGVALTLMRHGRRHSLTGQAGPAASSSASAAAAASSAAR
ncbi:MAG: hypothetical protein ACKOC8_10305 [Pirellulales bacterium]